MNTVREYSPSPAPAQAEIPLSADDVQLMTRLRGEFQEMPGLALTPPQAQRLFGLTPMQCERILSGLVLAGFLVSSHGMFRRRSAR